MKNKFKSLGARTTSYRYDSADPVLLESFPNPMERAPKGSECSIEIVAPEFTSLCPITGQPDFATIVVRYTPNRKCVESKSWKLYLGSYRQAQEFHESCVTRMAGHLVDLLDPLVLEIEGRFTPRGGISFWPKIVYHKKKRG
ncbi:MAG: preQ(1) synthase [Alphaproteobacteria bacterium]